MERIEEGGRDGRRTGREGWEEEVGMCGEKEWRVSGRNTSRSANLVV